MKLKLFFLTSLSVAGLLLPVNSFAANPLSVRLGQPKTPTNQNNLKLTFVALDINGGAITVGCYKKSPTDGSFVKFDVDKVLIPGGNTDYCNVDSSILNTAGTYSFKVIANSLESNVVSVDYNNSGPSTPGSYSKEKINSCDYKIKFKTADDGKTVKVELFRSDTKSISVSSGNVLASQNIGPNQEGQFIVTSPDCNKEYFFALRAVDNSDNVSGTTGDDFTKVTTTSSTTTTTGTTNPSAIALGSGSQVSEVTGEPTTSVTPEVTGQPTPEASVTPEVLGTQTSKINYLRWAEAALLIIAVFFFFKSKKRA